MALIQQSNLQCIVELGFNRNADDDPTWVGTGLFYADDLRLNEAGQTQFRPFLLTNRHVLEQIIGASNHLVIRLRKNSGGSQNVKHPLRKENGQPLWQFHPNTLHVDAAAMKIFLPDLKSLDCRFQVAGQSLLWRKTTMQENGCGEGDRILVVGYPYSIEQISPHSRAYPILRSGIISRIADLYDGETEVFVIDATVYPGNSGSPVFTVPGAVALPDTRNVRASAIIGFVSEYLYYRDTAISESNQRPRVYFIENSGLAKVETVDSMLDTLDILKRRLEQEKEEEGLISEGEASPQKQTS